MVVSNNILHMLWCNDRDGTTALYYSFSTDYGNTWNKVAKLSECVGYVLINKVPYYAMGAHTILAVDSHIHIVFYDDRTGVNEIYYTRGIISGQKDINIAATSGLSPGIGFEK